MQIMQGNQCAGCKSLQHKIQSCCPCECEVKLAGSHVRELTHIKLPGSHVLEMTYGLENGDMMDPTFTSSSVLAWSSVSLFVEILLHQSSEYVFRYPGFQLFKDLLHQSSDCAFCQ
jgi:hypothetical protein